MKLWHNILLGVYAAAPFVALAGVNDLEALALERAYQNRECSYQEKLYKEKDYQKRYDEGFKRGVEVANYGARAEAFTILKDILERAGLSEEEIRTASIDITSGKIQ